MQLKLLRDFFNLHASLDDYRILNSGIHVADAFSATTGKGKSAMRPNGNSSKNARFSLQDGEIDHQQNDDGWGRFGGQWAGPQFGRGGKRGRHSFRGSGNRCGFGRKRIQRKSGKRNGSRRRAGKRW